ncbi:hypothetical protein SUGI_0803550 [Cryptomeria japonica]|nr:hypothetical protein SUGI_0803550 [Cryptomeria japonica]
MSFRWKLNFDGSAKGSAGCVIRDVDWILFCGASKCLDACTNNVVEMEALALGIKLCIKFDIRYVEIEGDSLLCIRAISSGRSLNWHLDNWAEYICGLLVNVKDFSLRHVYREANRAADWVANHVVLQDIEIIDD